MMRMLGVISAGLMLLGLTRLLADEPPSDAPNEKPAAVTIPDFTSPDANLATEKYDLASQKVETEYKKQLALKKRDYINDLTAALAKSTRNNQVDEAARILQFKQQLEAGTALEKAAGKLQINNALYGVEGTKEYVNVTRLVREAIHDGKLVLTGLKYPDPAFGKHKIFVIDGTYSGIPFRIKALDNIMEGFEFGSSAH